MNAVKDGRGRPSLYTAEIAEEICRRLSAGQTLREVCRSDGMPSEGTVRAWALDDYNGFSTQYTRAREIGYLCLADELIEVSDNGTNDWMERQGDDAGTGYVLNGEHVQR
nr:DNA packaging protein [Acidobacteriota bacterium]